MTIKTGAKVRATLLAPSTSIILAGVPARATLTVPVGTVFTTKTGDRVRATLFPRTYRAGELATVDVAGANGTITTTTLGGATPTPALTGTGLFRSFVAPILAQTTILTLSITDNAGTVTTRRIRVLEAPGEVLFGGVWVRSYRTTS